jgi:hypothetical protein
MNDMNVNVSVIEPIGKAIDRVKEMLFKPFDFQKWLVIGLCAWLANIGSSGFSFNFPTSKDYSSITEVKYYFMQNMFWLIPLLVFCTALFTALYVIFLYLRCRGRFMFIHCIAKNIAQVSEPWKNYSGHANKLFIFSIIVGLIFFFAVMALTVPVLFLTFAKFFKAQLFIVFIGAAILMFIVVFIFMLVFKITEDFVVPIMYLRTSSCVGAWKEFINLLKLNKLNIFIYLLFQIVICFAIGAIIVASVCITCCCACCLYALPYVWAVILLPLLAFKRAYTLYYMQQFGEAYDVFAQKIEQVTVSQILTDGDIG